MGLEAATLALITGGVSAAATVAGVVNNNRARKAQEGIQAQQNASNRAQQIEEQRRLVREERIKRARILQASENTGTSGSSGETGAVGGMSTQLSSNLGFNAGATQRGAAIGALNQQVADASANAQLASLIGANANTIVGLGNNIFSPSSSDPLGDFIKQRGF